MLMEGFMRGQALFTCGKDVGRACREALSNLRDSLTLIDADAGQLDEAREQWSYGFGDLTSHVSELPAFPVCRPVAAVVCGKNYAFGKQEGVASGTLFLCNSWSGSYVTRKVNAADGGVIHG